MSEQITGASFRERRERTNVGVFRLEKKSGVSAGDISRWERGLMKMGAGRIEKIDKALKEYEQSA